jgi:hypothetical protein
VNAQVQVGNDMQLHVAIFLAPARSRQRDRRLIQDFAPKIVINKLNGLPAAKYQMQKWRKRATLRRQWTRAP